MEGIIRNTLTAPALEAGGGEAPWSESQAFSVALFHPKSSDHRPIVTARALHDEQTAYVQFEVEDRFVRCVRTENQDSVCKDSCVEFFTRPVEGKGYFNFELNCGGAMLLSYTEFEEDGDGMRVTNRVRVDEGLLRTIEIHTSMPRTVEPEIEAPTAWRAAMGIPRAVFEEFLGPMGAWSGQSWRGNFYKCGDETSHPHWASWAPIGEKLNFHQPAKFGTLRLE